MRICRLCLYKGDDRQVLSVWDNQVKDLATKILNCVSIHITRDDALPMWVCLSCIHQVTQWDIFRQTCRKSDEILRGIAAENNPQNGKGDEVQDTKCNIVEEDLQTTVKDLSLRTELCDGSIENFDGSTLQLLKENSNVEFVEEPRKKRRLRGNKKTSKIEYILPTDYSEEDIKEDDTDCLETEFVDLQTEYVENIYQCELCMQDFDNCFEHLDHQVFHDGDFIFQCDKCPELFNTRENLVNHDKNHRTPCYQCGKLVLKSSMKLHLIKHTDKYECKQCNGRFNSKAALAQHIITVHTDIKNHVCETCGKQFSSQTAMRVHLRSHSDERLYPCKICHYAGRTASAIYVHMSTHANDMCVCEMCSKTFKSTRNLNDHIRRVHSKVKKHHCTYCDKKFVDKYMLRVHVRCHTGVRPYQCTLCDKAFIRSDGLKEHMTTHGQRTYHDCKDCGKKFTSKRGVTRHICIAI